MQPVQNNRSAVKSPYLAQQNVLAVGPGMGEEKGGGEAS
jgi:hypothetical protein